MFRFCFLILILIFEIGFNAGIGNRKTYNEHRLIIARPDEDLSKEALHYHIKNESPECDILRSPKIHTQPSQILCPNEIITSELSKKLRSLNIDHEVWDGMSDRSANDERTYRSVTDFEHYPRYHEIKEYVQKIADEYPDFVDMSVKGKTKEDRDIIVLKLGNSSDGNDTRAIWFDAGIHAREWVSPTSGLYTINQIVQNHVKAKNGQPHDEDVVAVNWIIMPLLNPDGYEYSHTHDRMWRKNRTPNSRGSDCYGVDLMRNFDTTGFGIGASSDPCSNTYKGSGRNSEIETRIAFKEILDNAYNIRVSLSLHSIGESWLTSFGYRNKPPVDNEKLLKWGNDAKNAIKSLYGTEYEVGSAGATLYLAGGAIDDFSKDVGKIPYVATVELSGTNGDGYGFMMPAKYIRKIGEEMWEGMKVCAKYARNEPLGPSKTSDEEEIMTNRWLAERSIET